VRDGHTLDVVPSHRLAVDYGTSNTVAVLQRPDGTARPLLFDASPLLPSAVFAEGGGRMLVGRDADHASRLDPARYEPNPKRRINDLDILLGDRSYSMVDLVAAVLRRVAVEAVRVAGGPVSDVTITCPAAWGQARRRVLMEAPGQVVTSIGDPGVRPRWPGTGGRRRGADRRLHFRRHGRPGR